MGSTFRRGRTERTDGVVVVGHHVGEGVRNISTSDDFSRFVGLVAELWKCKAGMTENNGRAYQKEGKDDAAHKEPFSGFERDCNAAKVFAVLVEDFVGPRRGGQHGCGGVDIDDVYGKRL